MNRQARFVFFIFLYWLFLSADSSAAESPVLIFPESLIVELGITPQDIFKNQEKYRTNSIHLEWMAHVNDVIPEIDPGKKAMVAGLHTSMLYMKDRINSAYLSGRINQQAFTAQSAELMKWFLNSHQEILSQKEYDSLFGPAQNGEPLPVIPTGNELGFPIENPGTTVEMIKEKLDGQTITEIARFYQEHVQELRDIQKTYETGVPGVEKAQIKNDMLRIEDELQAAYMTYCRKILTDEQFNMIFGQPDNKK
ncbi:MAG: hypothetical protein C4518_17695 [Desulfobacteraceae bacterium]|nr:MAG: hypothetical protein C4518_17695 [Desulfobacteraceae bacterium]